MLEKLNRFDHKLRAMNMEVSIESPEDELYLPSRFRPQVPEIPTAWNGALMDSSTSEQKETHEIAAEMSPTRSSNILRPVQAGSSKTVPNIALAVNTSQNLPSNTVPKPITPTKNTPITPPSSSTIATTSNVNSDIYGSGGSTPKLKFIPPNIKKGPLIYPKRTAPSPGGPINNK